MYAMNLKLDLPCMLNMEVGSACTECSGRIDNISTPMSTLYLQHDIYFRYVETGKCFGSWLHSKCNLHHTQNVENIIAYCILCIFWWLVTSIRLRIACNTRQLIRLVLHAVPSLKNGFTQKDVYCLWSESSKSMPCFHWMVGSKDFLVYLLASHIFYWYLLVDKWRQIQPIFHFTNDRTFLCSSKTLPSSTLLPLRICTISPLPLPTPSFSRHSIQIPYCLTVTKHLTHALFIDVP